MKSVITAAIGAIVLGAMTCAGSAQTEAQGLSEAARGEVREEIRSYLMENPEIIMEMMSILEEREQKATAASDVDLISKNREQIFSDGFSHVGGNPEGSFTIVEFLDYQCGYCRRAHPDIAELVADDGDIRLITKEMPILGPNSELAARAAISTLMLEGVDAYSTLNDAMMSAEGQITDASLDVFLKDAGLDAPQIREGMQDPEVTRRLVMTRSLAQDLEISGTPTFVFGNRIIRGFLPGEQMRSLVSELRAVN